MHFFLTVIARYHKAAPPEWIICLKGILQGVCISCAQMHILLLSLKIGLTFLFFFKLPPEFAEQRVCEMCCAHQDDRKMFTDLM